MALWRRGQDTQKIEYTETNFDDPPIVASLPWLVEIPDRPALTLKPCSVCQGGFEYANGLCYECTIEAEAYKLQGGQG